MKTLDQCLAEFGNADYTKEFLIRCAEIAAKEYAKYRKEEIEQFKASINKLRGLQ